ncbi:hypothetical protein EBR96_07240, partial [bacterium]|nr:hypothetical protein [bacterium]
MFRALDFFVNPDFFDRVFPGLSLYAQHFEPIAPNIYFRPICYRSEWAVSRVFVVLDPKTDRFSGVYIPLDFVFKPGTRLIRMGSENPQNPTDDVTFQDSLWRYKIGGRYFRPIEVTPLKPLTEDDVEPIQLAPVYRVNELSIGGLTPTSWIQNLTQINDKPIDELESIMRPGKCSNVGFLGPYDRLLEVLKADNMFIVDQCRLTNQTVGLALHF